ncbi:MAG TPA: hypothetical protein VGQ51_08030 [Puia sp.]|jgi:hypothetical protein|nr:hypothetical protein [Puia sp.]
MTPFFSRLGRFLLLALVPIALVAFLVWWLLQLTTVNDILAAVIIHILAGTLVAFLFLYLVLVFMRPKLMISKYICKRGDMYLFKIVNTSRYHAFDVKIEMFKMVPVSHTGGRSNVSIHHIKMHTSEWTSINRVRRKFSDKDPFCLFAQVIFTEVDIETPLFENGTFLEMRLTARHGLTGFADRFVQQFVNESVLKVGHKFCFGVDLGTMPENQAF